MCCSEGDVVSLHLLQLAFGERKCSASGKIIYEVQANPASSTIPPIVHQGGGGHSVTVVSHVCRVWSTVRSVTVRIWAVVCFLSELKPHTLACSAARPSRSSVIILTERIALTKVTALSRHHKNTVRLFYSQIKNYWHLFESDVCYGFDMLWFYSGFSSTGFLFSWFPA